MAMTTDSSPRGGGGGGAGGGGSGGGGGGANSSHNRKNLPSPWAQVVQGKSDSIPGINLSPSSASTMSPSRIAEQSSFTSDCSPRKASPPPVEAEGSDEGNGNAGKAKKPAWSKPALTPNGVAAESSSSVMGANMWPALSESTKPSPKSAAVDAKVVSDESSSSPSSQAPLLPHSPHKQGAGSGKSNSTQNHGPPGRTRSFKRGGGGGGNSNSGGGHSQSSSFSHPPPPPPPPPPYPVIAVIPNGYATMVPPIPDQGPIEPPYRGNNWEPRPVVGFMPPPHMVNDHGHSPRRSNFRPRGDGSHHSNFGSRRDQDRGHHGSGTNVHVQSPRGHPRAFVRHPPPNAARFIPSQPIRPFMNPVVYPGQEVLYVPTLPMEPYRMPFIPPMPAVMMQPVQDPALAASLLHQIEYYFSDANLFKDEYLKTNMDEHGWVPITLIAGFNRVKTMTTDIQFILDSLRVSTFLEIQDEKVRRRYDWMKWILNPNPDVLSTSIQMITMDDVAVQPDDTTISLQSPMGDPSPETMAHSHVPPFERD